MMIVNVVLLFVNNSLPLKFVGNFLKTFNEVSGFLKLNTTYLILADFLKSLPLFLEYLGSMQFPNYIETSQSQTNGLVLITSQPAFTWSKLIETLE